MQLPVSINSKKGTLPNLIIIGAQKCATTSLHYYLGLHPQISMSREKELNFFVRERNWDKGIEWYKQHFTKKASIRGESSPSYTHFPFFGGVPERMYSVVPEAKLIYLLRDPIERIVSNYVHIYASGHENRKLSDALKNLDNNHYVCRSKYYMQLEQYLNYFPKSNILLLTMEDLYNHRLQTLQKTLRFLNADDTFYSRKYSKIKHKSNSKRRKTFTGRFLARTLGTNIVGKLPPEVRGKAETMLYLPFSRRIQRPTLNESLRRKLIDHLRDDVERLRNYTGNPFEGWCM